MSSLQEKVAAKQGQAGQSQQGQAVGAPSSIGVPLMERSASEIWYVDLLDFKIQIGPAMQSRANDVDFHFLWSARGTLLLREKASGNEFELHPSQFTLRYKPVKGWKPETSSVS